MSLFHHKHPYEVFIPPGTEKIIIGTLPPPRFSTNRLKSRDVNFCYGSCDNMLWPVIDEIFNLKLLYDNSKEAVEQRKRFLLDHKLGICDIVASCRRSKIDASDLGMQQIETRDLLHQLDLCPTLNIFLFAGGNSKNGPEYLFRKQLRKANLTLRVMRDDTPRVHSFFYADREITTYSLTSPSNAANRAIGSNSRYKSRKKNDPSYNTFRFRVDQYSEVL